MTMKKLFLAFLISAASFSAAQDHVITSPQIPLTGNVGCQGFPCVNTGTLVMASDADRNMTAMETSAPYIKVTSSVALTATRNLIAPLGRFPFSIQNATTGGQSIQIIGPTGLGVTIPNGQSVSVWNNGTDFIQVSGLIPNGLATSPGGNISGAGTATFGDVSDSVSALAAVRSTANAALPANGCTTTAGGNLNCTTVAAGKTTLSKTMSDVLSGNVPLTYFGSYNAFGDSITAGYNASVIGTNNYVALLGTQLGLTPTNHGVSAAMAADQMEEIYATTYSSSSHQLVSFEIGTNDRAVYGSNTSSQTLFQLIHAADLAYIATYGTNQLHAQGGCTTTGTWTASPYYNGMGMTSSSAGATITCTGLLGSVLYAGVTMVDGAIGEYSVTIDGNTQSNTLYYPYSNGFGGATISTITGRTYADQLVRIPVNPEVNVGHMMTITVVSGSVWVDWMAGNWHSQYSGSPIVMAAGPIPSGTAYLSNNVLNQDYGEIVRSNVTTLAADGLRIIDVRVYDYFDASLDDISSDGTHPNDLGHAHIAAAYFNALLSFLRTPSQEENGVRVTGYEPYAPIGPGGYLGYIRQPGLFQIKAVGAQTSSGFPYPTIQITSCKWHGTCFNPMYWLPSGDGYTFGNLYIGGYQFSVQSQTTPLYKSIFSQQSALSADSNILIPAGDGVPDTMILQGNAGLVGLSGPIQPSQGGTGGYNANVYLAGTKVALGKVLAFNSVISSSSATVVTFPNSFSFTTNTYYCSVGVLTSGSAFPSYANTSATTITVTGATAGSNYIFTCFGQ